MCARCPGGAYGLSKARAEAIKSFVAKCGVDTDRAIEDQLKQVGRDRGDGVEVRRSRLLRGDLGRTVRLALIVHGRAIVRRERLGEERRRRRPHASLQVSWLVWLGWLLCFVSRLRLLPGVMRDT